MDLAIDGIMRPPAHRKTRYGSWKERYFRTEGYDLMYYTENLNLIKANRLQGKTKGPYQFKPVGSPSETIDLRNSDCRIERLEDDATVFLMKHLGKVLEVKAQDEAQCERWLEVVQNIIDTERSKRKQVGTLKVAVDGCFLVGGRLASEGEEGPRHCCLSFKLRDETVTSDAAEIAVDDALSYENLDESHDAVGRAPVALEAELPIWQTSMAMEWKLSETGGHRKSEAPEGGHKKRRSSVAAFAAVVQSALATKEDDGPCVRTTTLFELQAENAITYMGAHRRYVASDAEQFDHATAASSLEGDVSADPFWPAFAPDGKAPMPGWRWRPGGSARELVSHSAEDDAPGASHDREVVKRAIAEINLSEMLIGVSSVKSKTLDPEWLNPGAAPTRDFGADDRASSSASSDSHLDSLLALLAPSLHNEGGAADVLGDVYDASASRNAAQLSAASVKYYGDCAPPIDFRSKWRPGAYGGVPSRRPGPTRSAIAVEVYDKDVTQTDDFLGAARISLADLVAAESGVVVGWLPLELSGDAAKDATLLGAEPTDGPHAYGEVFVKASIRLLDNSTSQTANWQYEQALCKSLLEPTFKIKEEKGAGYIGQYKSATRTMKSMQDSVLFMAAQLERVHALFTWAHPMKTGLMFFGLVCGIAAMCVIPNKLCVSGLITKLFFKGLCKLRGHDESEIVTPDPTDIQMANMLNSLPTAPQTAQAMAVKRKVWKAQHERELNRVRINLNFAFRVRCQFRCYVLDYHKLSQGKGAGASAADGKENGSARRSSSTRRRPGRRPTSPSSTAWCSSGRTSTPRRRTRSPRRPRHRARVAATRYLPPPRPGTKLLSVASTAGRDKKIRDFEISLKVEMVEAFADAVYAELTEGQAGKPDADGQKLKVN
ncbi:hypothetical protein JL720_6573 [Aureococcus anophagefferens]|nr:hypothetical protein JL720_6573 [Aureococcus anophagefferens]